MEIFITMVVIVIICDAARFKGAISYSTPFSTSQLIKYELTILAMAPYTFFAKLQP